MKKLLTLTVVGAILAAPAMAAYKCAPNWGLPYFSKTLTGGYSGPMSDFSITYDANGTDMFIMRASAQCSSRAPDFSTSSGMLGWGALPLSAGTYCWCRIISPAISKWIPIADTTKFATAAACGTGCTSACSAYLSSSSALSAVMPYGVWTQY
ncbi:MAG: hypothetical protein IJD41_04225 [Alphaproteobacteria bacterium]|nr:hypothetical protein [Alphaproteobacteria bacterium]